MHTGRQAPMPAPASAPVGITQLRPGLQPAQPVSPSHPEFCVQAEPLAPWPGQPQSVVSPSYTKQERPGAQPLLVTGSQGREHAEKRAVLPHWIGTLQ